MRKRDTIVAAANPVQYISRSKFFGLPLHAAYPIAAAIDGTTTKGNMGTDGTFSYFVREIVAISGGLARSYGLRAFWKGWAALLSSAQNLRPIVSRKRLTTKYLAGTQNPTTPTA
jgi:hypothetical protein